MKTTLHKLAPGQTWEGAHWRGTRTLRRIISADETGVLWDSPASEHVPRRSYYTPREAFMMWAERLMP